MTREKEMYDLGLLSVEKIVRKYSDSMIYKSGSAVYNHHYVSADGQKIKENGQKVKCIYFLYNYCINKISEAV